MARDVFPRRYYAQTLFSNVSSYSWVSNWRVCPSFRRTTRVCTDGKMLAGARRESLELCQCCEVIAFLACVRFFFLF